MARTVEKSTRLKRDRVARAEELLIEHTEREVMEILQQEFGCSLRSTYRDLDRAYESVGKALQISRTKRNLARALLQRDNLIRRCRDAGDLRAELAAMQDRDKLMGLYEFGEGSDKEVPL